MTPGACARLTAAFVAVAALGTLAVSARQTTPPPPQPATTTGSQPPAYSYDAEGRRDPFVSLVRRGTGEAGSRQGRPAAGVGGLLAGEIVLKGIMQSRGGFVALVQGPDGKTHLVRVNERLLDGSVRAITQDTLILMQDVNDPLSLTKQREVRLTLRPGGEPK
jgi:Tfp pilus assembly protein PilP